MVLVSKRLGKAVPNKLMENRNSMPCWKAEVKDCMFIHVEEFSSLGFRKSIAVTVYTHVLDISLYAF